MIPRCNHAPALLTATLLLGCGDPEPAPDAPPPVAADPGHDAVPVPADPARGFVDITSWAGLQAQFGGMGMTFADVDGDGFDDIVAPATNRSYVLRNRGDGSFYPTFVLDHAPHEWMHVYAAELTGDAHLDLLAIQEDGPRIWRGVGTGAFVPGDWDLPGGAGLMHGVASYGDLDGDGHLDLYLGRMSTIPPGGSTFDFSGGDCPTPEELRGVVNEDPPAPDLLLLRRGDHWEDATKAMGLDAPLYTQAIMMADLDSDGRLDLTVGTEGSRRDACYFSDGPAFTDLGPSGGMGLATSAMGYDAVDIDLDSDLDLYISDERGFLPGDKLYLQGPDRRWELATVERGLGDTKNGTGWGLGFHDFDHDGDLDLMVVNGSPVGNCPGGEQENFYFTNDGTGHFDRALQDAGGGLDSVEDSRALVFSDIDHDGDLDALVSNILAAPQLLRNDLSAGHWLMVRPVHPTLRPAVGARLDLTLPDGRTLRRDVHGTPSFGGTSTEWVHFGLGEATSGTLVVTWPTGEKTGPVPLAAGTRIDVRP